jgi:hypothetical protein
VPYLLGRVWVYEIAIGCGYCCLSAALFFLTRAAGSSRAGWWLGGAGLMFGCAIACRPHLGLAAVAATAGLAVWSLRARRIRLMVPFLVPLVTAGLAIAIYNYQRFGNPFEFGVRYLMGNPMLNRTELAARYVGPGLYYMLICPPQFGPVFPWVRLAFRYPFDVPGYFLEPTVGVLFLAPFLLGILLILRARGVRIWPVLMLITAAAIMLFVTGTGFTSQRYEVDFLPLAVMAATCGWGVAMARSSGWTRRTLIALFSVLLTAGMITGLALGVAGPYDEFLRNRPAAYLRIAQRLSPLERYRPVLNPRIDLEFMATCKAQDDGFREPLLTLGHQTYRDIVLLEHHSGKFRLISQSETTSAVREIEDPGARPLGIHVQYKPETRQLVVSVDGVEVVTHTLEALLTAPAQITPGENRVAPEVSAARFTGRIVQR